MLAGYRNAFYDEASVDPFEQVNQQVYVVEVLAELKLLMPDFEKYNFVFFSGNAGMRPVMVSSPLPNKVLIQWEDQLGTEPDKDVMSAFVHVFKTHLRHRSTNYRNLHSYPLGIPYKVKTKPILQMEQREVSVFYAGNLNDNRLPFYKAILRCCHQSYIRRLVSSLLATCMGLVSEKGKLRCLNLKIKSLIFKIGHTEFDNIFSKSIIRFTRSFQAGFSPEEYSENLSKSKIVLSPKGFFNTECFRFYEALRQGCVVITEPLPVTDYYDKRCYIEVEEWTGIEETINALLSDPDRLQRMQDAGIRYYKEKLSPKGVARYIISKING